MSITLQLEDLLMNTKQTEEFEKFQQQYSEMLKLGVIHRKSYNLAGVNIVGDLSNSSLTSSHTMASVANCNE